VQRDLGNFLAIDEKAICLRGMIDKPLRQRPFIGVVKAILAAGGELGALPRLDVVDELKRAIPVSPPDHQRCIFATFRDRT
jgi:hypothetical protein